jgi:acetate kinase
VLRFPDLNQHPRTARIIMSEVDLKKFFLEQVRLFESFLPTRSRPSSAQSRLTTYEGNEAILETGDEARTSAS